MWLAPSYGLTLRSNGTVQKRAAPSLHVRGRELYAMSDAKSDTFARSLAIISLFVAIAAIALPYIEQRRQFQVLQTEDLAVSLNPHTDGPIRLTDRNFGPKGRLIQVPWDLTLSNTGNQKLSIIRYSISTGASPHSNYYGGIDGGVLQADQKPLDLPLMLEPGESRSLVVFVGVLVPPAVYEVLSSLKKPGLRTVRSARDALSKRGMDIYGNKVSYTEYAPGIYELTVEPENQRSPRFWYEAVTGRGNTFLTSATEYERPK